MAGQRVLRSIAVAIVILALLTALRVIWIVQNQSLASVIPLAAKKSPLETTAEVPRRPISTRRETVITEPSNLVTKSERRRNGTHRLAIVIPFRDRDAHLAAFIKHMVPFLSKQNLIFHIYVIEQTKKGLFNRGKLSNIGFLIAKERGYDYVCFHDVDMLPLNHGNRYSYPQENPRHHATCVEQFNYKLPFKWYSGGVIAFTLEQYEKINGMSNVYFGWGKEDDDLHRRIVSSGYRIDRQDPQAGSECVGMYASLDHGPRDYSSTKRNNELLNGSRERQSDDGLNSVRYRKLNESLVNDAFTRIIVDVCIEVRLVSASEVGCGGEA
ncbi:beta-1,4-galactosyltransferase 6-like [Oscarella lobularis]|uniref:beta-1,4-galactosyltransferase 6-like n=1 Tax=Oscarella lobularis TaxID=121494 RepID=UPI003313ED58